MGVTVKTTRAGDGKTFPKKGDKLTSKILLQNQRHKGDSRAAPPPATPAVHQNGPTLEVCEYRRECVWLRAGFEVGPKEAPTTARAGVRLAHLSSFGGLPLVRQCTTPGRWRMARSSTRASTRAVRSPSRSAWVRSSKAGTRVSFRCRWARRPFSISRRTLATAREVGVGARARAPRSTPPTRALLLPVLLATVRPPCLCCCFLFQLCVHPPPSATHPPPHHARCWCWPLTLPSPRWHGASLSLSASAGAGGVIPGNADLIFDVELISIGSTDM